mmetsp:Transcript_71781/g.207926  ORF Transcript_71781/g.207926 Transcript_71781/m.207926 type:complete len:329 (-) Transcript_71781:152-1138(-)
MAAEARAALRCHTARDARHPGSGAVGHADAAHRQGNRRGRQRQEEVGPRHRGGDAPGSRRGAPGRGGRRAAGHLVEFPPQGLDHHRLARPALLVELASDRGRLVGKVHHADEGAPGAHEGGDFPPRAEQEQVHDDVAGSLSDLMGPPESQPGDEAPWRGLPHRRGPRPGLPASIQQLGDGRLREADLRLDHRLDGLPRQQGEARGPPGERGRRVRRAAGLLHLRREFFRHPVGRIHAGDLADDHLQHVRAEALHLPPRARHGLPRRTAPELRRGQRDGGREAWEAADKGATGLRTEQAEGGREHEGQRRAALLRRLRPAGLRALRDRG